MRKEPVRDRSSSARGGGASWPLRVSLLAALGALVVTGSVVASMSSPPSSLPTPPLPTPPRLAQPAGHATTTTSPKRGHERPPTSTAPTVPGAYSGPVRVGSIGHGCGLSLAPPPSAKPRPVGHCTVLEIGDSMGNDLGWGISRHLAASAGLDLVQDDTASTGLSNSWFYSWPVHLAADLKQVHPQLLLVSLGGNDEQGMQVGGKVLSFGTPAWQQVYLSYVRQIITEATSAGAYVVWVGMPIMGEGPSYDEGMALLDSLYEKAATSEPDATYVSTYSLFANPEGQFQANAVVNGVATALREPDDIHYSFAGEDVVATYVIRELARIYHVALAATSPAVITGWG